MVNGFKTIGHNVKTCGPARGNYDGELLSKHDIPVYDKVNHPEDYQYDYIVGLYESKYGYRPDIIIQTDPHFYLIGQKPKDIFCYYWIMDVHRGPVVFRNMATMGHFDKILISQKYYMPVFQRAGLDCVYMPWAYDDTVIFEQPTIEQQCDISFVGTTGIKDQDSLFNENYEYDEELKLKYINLADYANLPNEKKYMSWEEGNLEYADRLEYLIRLSQDFNVRIYERCYGEQYAKALSRGQLGFHCSLRRDITLRVFEVPAINRLLITDDIPYLDGFMYYIVHYRKYYQPQFDAFKLDYEEVKESVECCLSNIKERKIMANRSMEYVKNNHTFKHRAEQILKLLEYPYDNKYYENFDCR
jgi:hypothetical protein